MVNRSLKLTIEDKTYQVEVIKPGTISVDGNLFQIEVDETGVKVNGDAMTASLSEGFAIVGGKLYDTEWIVG